jgi:hypothetical protein
VPKKTKIIFLTDISILFTVGLAEIATSPVAFRLPALDSINSDSEAFRTVLVAPT